jgi:Transmembrane secretion effector
MAAGGIVAAMLTVRLRRRLGTMRVLLLDPFRTLLLVAPAAFGAPLWLVAGGVIVAGAGSSVWRIVVATIRQEITPAEQLGRVYSAARVISLGTYPLGAALAGAIANQAGVGAAMLAASVVAAAIVIASAIVLPHAGLPTDH